jgi:hypothetical protein
VLREHARGQQTAMTDRSADRGSAQSARDWLSARYVALPFACATAVLLLLQVGYGFEVGDQLQYLLLPYRSLYPEFLLGDWFAWETSHYHVTFSWLVRAAAWSSGLPHLPYAVFVLHLLNLAAFGYAVLRLSFALGMGLFEATFAIFGFALVRQLGLAGAIVDHAGLVPSDLALPPFLLACAAYAEGRSMALGAWLGVSGFLHANYAVLGPLALYPLELLRCWQRRSLSSLFASCALFGVLASPTLLLLVQAFLVRDPAPQAVAVTLFVRSPHHYDLSAMRPDEVYYALALGCTTLPLALGRVSPGQPGRRSFLLLSAALLGLLVFGAIGSGAHVLSLSRLFMWRMSIPLFALWLMAAGFAVRSLARQRAFVPLSWLLLTCAVLTTFAQTDPLEQSSWNELPRAAAIGGGLLALASLCAQLRVAAPGLRMLLGALCLVCSVSAAALALSVVHRPVWFGDKLVRPRGLHFMDGQIALTTPLRPLYAQIREQTPTDARFLVPPGQSQFRLQARRAIFVDWKCAPMKGDEALEWQRRMLLAMGTPSFPARGYALPRAADAAYNARPLADLAELARREGLTHILVRRHAGSTPNRLQHVFDSGPFVVYALQ